MKPFFLSILFLTTVGTATARQVVRINTFSGGLQKEFESAFQANRSSENFWIAYSIRRSDAREFIIGSWYSYNDDNPVTLRDIIMHNAPRNDSNPQSPRGRRGRFSGFSINDGVSINRKGGDNETAILVLYDRESKSIDDFRSIDVCSMSRTIDLYGYPLAWIASDVEPSKSVEFLTTLFAATGYDISRRELIPAIGIHSDQPAVTKFLEHEYRGTTDGKAKRKIAFWLGFQENGTALDVLGKIITDNDEQMEIRKEAVMGLGFNRLPRSLDELIAIAKTNSQQELRKQAIYGLSNKAVGKAEETLKGIVDNDPNIEIKKNAVYALANMQQDVVPYLITVARSNRSVEIRKCAIYSLGNIADDKAVDALISLAEGK